MTKRSLFAFVLVGAALGGLGGLALFEWGATAITIALAATAVAIFLFIQVYEIVTIWEYSRREQPRIGRRQLFIGLGGTILVVAVIVLLYTVSRDWGSEAKGALVISGILAFAILEVLVIEYESRQRMKRGGDVPFSLIGATATVARRCAPEGTVKVGAALWKAESVDGEALEPGDEVVIVERRDLTLRVRRAELR